MLIIHCVILCGVKLHNTNKSKLEVTCCLGSVFSFLIGFVCQDDGICRVICLFSFASKFSTELGDIFVSIWRHDKRLRKEGTIRYTI